MRADAFLSRWIDLLAALLLSAREAWRARRSLIVSRQDNILHVWRRDKGNPAPFGSFAAGQAAPPEVVAAARKSLVVYELPSDKLVVRHITVPAQAREFLPGIVRNQIERLSPWQADQAVYGFDASPTAEDAAVLDVPISITSRETVERACEEVAAGGLTVDRIVARDGEQGPVLWSRLADASRQSLDRARWRIGAAMMALVVASAGISAWAFWSAGSIRDASDGVAERARVIQRQLQGAHTPQSLATLNPAERAWVSKETLPSAVIALEALSRALPDSAYLSELQLEKTTLRIVGLTDDAPALIAPIEGSGHFTDAHFFAPTTRGTDGSLFRFHIEARLKPQPEIAEATP